MSNPKPGPGRPFQKGIAPNPKGSSALARELGNIKKINQNEVQALLNKFSEMSNEETVAFFADKTNKNLELIIAKIVIEAQNGDTARCEFLLNRMVGKVKDTHEHQIVGSMHAAIVDTIMEIENANRLEVSNGKTSEKTIQEVIQTTQEVIEEDDLGF